MAELKFYGNIKSSEGDGELINHSAGSGLGFYGLGFGVSVPIDTRQKTTFITNELGVNAGSQLNNTETISIGDDETIGTVSINSSDAINLDRLPNYLCPLNIRFEHTEPVAVQNCKLRIFDRNDIDKHASGVSTYVYEARHPSDDQSVTNLSHRGRTANSWFLFEASGDMSDMLFTHSPGISGTNSDSTDTEVLGALSFQGDVHQSIRHDWYVALSAEPDTIGSKTNYGLYFTLEYL